MSELCWRDKATGREDIFPWPVPEGDLLLVSDPLVKETEAGRCVLYSDVLADETFAGALTFPGGVWFVRCSPDTGWSMEERGEGTVPPSIADELTSTWRTFLESVATGAKIVRGFSSPAPTEEERR